MANKKRGEVDLVLQGETYTLRPTFQALEEIESSMGMGLIEIGSNFTQQAFRMTDVVKILHPIMRHHDNPDTGKPWTYHELGEAIIQQGFTETVPVLGAFFAYALGVDPEEEADTSPPVKRRKKN